MKNSNSKDDRKNPMNHILLSSAVDTPSRLLTGPHFPDTISMLSEPHDAESDRALTIMIDEGSEDNLSGSTKSKSELLDLLPHQQFSESDGILGFTFSLTPLINSAAETTESQVSVKLVVDSAPGCGGIVWPAGQILSSYLTRSYESDTPLAGKSVIELGSGTGLVGLVAGKLDASAKIYITDQAPLLDIMNKNVKLNYLESNVKVVELNWGEPVPQDIPSKADIILAADCVYFEPAFPLLVETLADLSDTNTHILFCYKKRRKADKRFFSLLKKKFTWTQVNDPNRAIYNKEAIMFLRLWKIPERN